MGIDLGLTSFLASSEGETVAPAGLPEAQEALRRAQRRVARRKKGRPSPEGGRAGPAVAPEGGPAARDFHHKTALALVHRSACLPRALNITGIARSRLAKSTRTGLEQLLTILQHKAEGAGVAVIAVPPYNTSQACSACGALPAVPKTLA